MYMKKVALAKEKGVSVKELFPKPTPIKTKLCKSKKLSYGKKQVIETVVINDKAKDISCEFLRTDVTDPLEIKQEPLETEISIKTEPGEENGISYNNLSESSYFPQSLDLVDSMFLDFAKRFKMLSSKWQLHIRSSMIQMMAQAEINAMKNERSIFE